jgi:hypothetical protein
MAFESSTFRQFWRLKQSGIALQVRAELLNGTLTDAYRVANPRFRGPSGFAQALH